MARPTQLALASLLSLSACAHGTAPEAALSDLRAKLTDAQRKEAEGRRRIDELENRVFLLTDQLESSRVAQTARAPRLPVVTLRPSEEERASALAPREPVVEETTAPSIGSRRHAAPDGAMEGSDDIEFVGAARSADARHVRPVLRGEGSSPPAVVGSRRHAAPDMEAQERTPRAAAPDVRLASVSRRTAASDGASAAPVVLSGGDSLGVAPAPPIARAASRPAAPPPAAHAPITPAVERAPLDQEPLTLYRTAYAEVTAGRYAEAATQLRAFVKRFPRHDYADNAQYWIGECLYAQKLYREAAIEFRATVARYPVGNKAPDALLKLAYSLLALGEHAEARRLLAEIGTSYARSDASRLAAIKLAELSPSQKPSVEEPR